MASWECGVQLSILAIMYQVSSLNKGGRLSLYLEGKYVNLWNRCIDFRCIHVGIFNVGTFLYVRCWRSYYSPMVNGEILKAFKGI